MILCLIGYLIAGRMTHKGYPMTDDIRSEVYGSQVTNKDLVAWANNDYSRVAEATHTKSLGLEENASGLAACAPGRFWSPYWARSVS